MPGRPPGRGGSRSSPAPHEAAPPERGGVDQEGGAGAEEGAGGQALDRPRRQQPGERRLGDQDRLGQRQGGDRDQEHALAPDAVRELAQAQHRGHQRDHVAAEEEGDDGVAEAELLLVERDQGVIRLVPRANSTSTAQVRQTRLTAPPGTGRSRPARTARPAPGRWPGRRPRPPGLVRAQPRQQGRGAGRRPAPAAPGGRRGGRWPAAPGRRSPRPQRPEGGPAQLDRPARPAADRLRAAWSRARGSRSQAGPARAPGAPKPGPAARAAAGVEGRPGRQGLDGLQAHGRGGVGGGAEALARGLHERAPRRGRGRGPGCAGTSRPASGRVGRASPARAPGGGGGGGRPPAPGPPARGGPRGADQAAGRPPHRLQGAEGREGGGERGSSPSTSRPGEARPVRLGRRGVPRTLGARRPRRGGPAGGGGAVARRAPGAPRPLAGGPGAAGPAIVDRAVAEVGRAASPGASSSRRWRCSTPCPPWPRRSGPGRCRRPRGRRCWSGRPMGWCSAGTRPTRRCGFRPWSPPRPSPPATPSWRALLAGARRGAGARGPRRALAGRRDRARRTARPRGRAAGLGPGRARGRRPRLERHLQAPARGARGRLRRRRPPAALHRRGLGQRRHGRAGRCRPRPGRPGGGVGGFANAGQLCMAAKRIIVERAAWGFRPRLAAAVAALRVGDPDEEGTDIGPLPEGRGRAAARAALAEALRRGGRVLVGEGERGPHFTPTVVLLPRDALDVALWREESFAPARAGPGRGRRRRPGPGQRHPLRPGGGGLRPRRGGGGRPAGGAGDGRRGPALPGPAPRGRRGGRQRHGGRAAQARAAGLRLSRAPRPGLGGLGRPCP